MIRVLQVFAILILIPGWFWALRQLMASGDLRWGFSLVMFPFMLWFLIWITEETRLQGKELDQLDKLEKDERNSR